MKPMTNHRLRFECASLINFQSATSIVLIGFTHKKCLIEEITTFIWHILCSLLSKLQAKSLKNWRKRDDTSTSHVRPTELIVKCVIVFFIWYIYVVCVLSVCMCVCVVGLATPIDTVKSILLRLLPKCESLFTACAFHISCVYIFQRI